MYAKAFINRIPTKVFDKMRNSKGDAECRRALLELLMQEEEEPCKSGWHSSDFNGKCLMCGEQIFNKN